MNSAFFQKIEGILHTERIDAYRLMASSAPSFHEMASLSLRNLLSMELFAEAFPEPPIAKQPVSQLPWGHIILLLQKAKPPADRLWHNIMEGLSYGRGESPANGAAYTRPGQRPGAAGGGAK